MKDILEKIISRRKEKGVTQEEMGALLDIGRQSYNMREKGKREISIDELKTICSKLELTILVVDNELVIK